MQLIARPISQWPGAMTPDNKRLSSSFTASWTATTQVLEREVAHLAGWDAEVVLELAVSERECRLDGWIRADAKPAHPGVIVSFDSKHGPLRYATDQFNSQSWGKYLPGWQANVRAVALALEALRKVDRYGVSRGGEQYRGWTAIGSGIAVSAIPEPMTLTDAAVLLGGALGDVGLGTSLLVDRALALQAYRAGMKLLHPDHGGNGDSAAITRLNEAWRMVKEHHGG